MNVYRLENNGQDKQFLAGSPVICRAVLSRKRETIQPGEYILVELSNGKKYKGRVMEFRSFQVKEVEAGDLVICRA